jgi:hypothetical protein
MQLAPAALARQLRVDVQASIAVGDVRRAVVVDLQRVRIEQTLAVLGRVVVESQRVPQRRFVPMIPGTTIAGMVLFGGISARPRVLSEVGVRTVVVNQPPSGKGIRGGGRPGKSEDAQSWHAVQPQPLSPHR